MLLPREYRTFVPSFVSNEVQHKGASHVMFFDCPKGHRYEARRLWKESQEQEKSELAQLNAGVKADLDKRGERSIAQDDQ